MNLARALNAVSKRILSASKPELRGTHGNQPRKEQHPGAKLTQSRADDLRLIRERDGLTIKDLNFRHAPDLSYWLVKSIFRSDSCW